MRPNATTAPLLTLHLLWLGALLAALAALTGCGIGPIAAPSPASGASFHGHVHGGQQPVAGAHVYLLAANTTGYAGNGIDPSSSNASISLLDPLVTGLSDPTGAYVLSDSQGNFDISGDYTCTPGQQVYLFAYRGDSGTGSNIHIGLMTILGNCPLSGDFSAVPFVEINEVSTVAAAYAIAGYATDAFHVSSNGSPQALTGIANAFASASNLVDLGSGVALALTPAGNGYPPNTTINTLANILAACVNSADEGNPIEPSPSFACSQLLSANYSNGAMGNAAIHTANAAIFMAHHPAHNVAYLYAIPTATGPFAPALSSQPNDFSLGISFYNGGLSFPLAVALDAQGNVWFTNLVAAVSEFSPLGDALSPDAGFTGGGLTEESYGIAIDVTGNAWITNYEVNSLSEFSNAGLALSPSLGFTGDGLNCPEAAAFDTSGNLWVSNNCALTLSRFDSTGNPATGTGFTGGGLNGPNSLAIDALGNLWTANNAGGSISELDYTGSPISPNTGFTGGGINGVVTAAIDGTGNVWAVNYIGNSLSEFSSAGLALSSSSGFTGGGLNHPGSIAVDGAGNLWAANTADISVSEFSNSGTPISPSTGYTGAGAVAYPSAMAVDSAGNVWMAQSGNSIAELIGIASPVETPIVKALTDNCLAHLPCTPAPPPP